MKKQLLFLLTLSIIFTTLQAQTYSGGSGTEADPYQIANKADLQYLSENSGEWSKHFKQTADINFANADFQSGGDFYNNGKGFIPVGSNANLFTGTYNGQGNTITNLQINRSSDDNIGMFGKTGGPSIIKNLGLVDNDIYGHRYVGGIAGYNNGLIDNCYTTGPVKAKDQDVGGIAGINYGPIINCHATGNILASGTADSQTAGGLVGDHRGTIDNCYATGNVTCTPVPMPTDYNNAGMEVGGLAGYVYSTPGISITNSFATGTVEGVEEVGGLVGDNKCNISGCYATGQVRCKPVSTSQYGSEGGGFVGVNYGNVENCYTFSNVLRITSGRANSYGGFVGRQASGSIKKSYCANTVTASTGTAIDGNRAFSGYGMTQNDASTKNFADQTVSNQTNVYGAVFKTTTQLKTSTTYSDADYDLTVIWNRDGSTNNGYAFLRANPEYTWTGASGSDWATVANWTGTSLPTYGSRATIPDVANDPVIANGTSATCNYLNIASNASLSIQSGGTLTASGPTAVNGTLNIENGGSFIDNAMITNNGSINVEKSISDNAWHMVTVPNNNTSANAFFDDYLQYWSEEYLSWIEIIDPATELNPVQGYALWHESRADYTFTGTPNTGLQSTTLSYHNNGSSEYNGFNLVGNPYPSSIDWDMLHGTYGTAYIWNPTTSDYIENTSTNIAPMQGFFIYTTNHGSSFTLQNLDRVHGGTFYKASAANSNSLVLTATYANFEDELFFHFKDSAYEGFNLYEDAWKLLSSSEGVSQLWSVSPDGKLAIDKRPYTETIQLGFSNDQPGVYSIAISEIADITEATLEDTKTNTFHNLQSGAYEFAWNPETDLESRFKLHLNVVGIDENQISESEILIYATDGQIIIKNKTDDLEMRGRASLLTISDIMGRTVLKQNFNASEINIIPVNLKTGVYIVSVKSGNEIKTEKLFVK